MRKLIFLVILIFAGSQVWGEVTAWVNKNPVVVGNMFQLHIEAKNVDDAEEPDLSSIQGLQVLNRSVQNQTSIMGTSVSRTVSWTYILIAPSAGNYLIPALQVGNEQTSPISLEAIVSTLNPQQKLVRLEVDVTPKKVYPQQQVLVRLRISRGDQLENESITPFELAGAQVEKLSQRSHQTVKNGKKQEITEIVYAVLPEKSGTIVIPQVRYHGEVMQGGITQRNFGNLRDFGNLFQKRGRRIFSTSEQQTVEVKPMPSGFKGWWLPADKLVIEEMWQPDPPLFRVGEPVTRTVAIFANGAFGNQIPEISFVYPAAIKGYADQPVIETEKTSEGLKGMRKEKWALIPNQAGKIKLPGISVSWWDVSRDELRTAVIPSKIINVLPVPGSQPQNTALETPVPQKNKTETAVLQEPVRAEESFPWKNAAIGFALLWGLTMLLWFVNRNKKIASTIKKEENFIQDQQNAIRETTKNVEKAFRSGDPGTVQTALLKWGNSVWVNDPPQGLEQIVERMPELKNGINALNSVLYGKHQNGNSLEELHTDFRRISLSDKKSNNNKYTQLKPMYPE
ncbi:MAG: BatD family protein [SAR324 cluster bacterium]|nr:BatD family protein [SAR324 cluster bacterium]